MLDTNTTAAISGAIELFLGRINGLKRFDMSFEGFWRSFAALLYVLPLFAVMIAAEWPAQAQQISAPALANFIAARLVDLALDFCAIPIALAVLAKRLGITRSYAGYMVVRNWSSIVMVAPQAAISLVFRLGLVSMEVSALLSLIVAGVMLFYQYRITRWTLNWNGTQAAGLVAADLASSVVLLFLIDSLFGL